MGSRSYSFEEMQKLAAECARGYGPAGVDEPTGDYFGVREEEWEAFKFMQAAANLTLSKHHRFRPSRPAEIDDVSFGFLQAWRMGRVAGAGEAVEDIEADEDSFYMVRPEIEHTKPGDETSEPNEKERKR